MTQVKESREVFLAEAFVVVDEKKIIQDFNDAVDIILSIKNPHQGIGEIFKNSARCGGAHAQHLLIIKFSVEGKPK